MEAPVAVGTLVPIVGIIVTAVIAVRTIRSVAEANRVTGSHERMSECLIRSFLVVRRAFLLVDAVANQDTYSDRISGEITGNAFDRFVAAMPEISREFNSLMGEQELLLPTEAFTQCKRLLERVNAAAAAAYRAQPRDNVFPDTGAVVRQVNELFAAYTDALEVFRRYLGSNALTVLAGRPTSAVDQEARDAS